MTALAMQIELKRLALRHDAAEPKPCFVPLAAPVDYVIEITGLASTTDIDLSRQIPRLRLQQSMPAAQRLSAAEIAVQAR